MSGVGVLAHTIGSSFVVHGVLFAELLVALALSAAVGWFAMERMTGWFGATVTFVAGITCWAMALLLILLLFNVAPEGIPSAILRLWASAEALL